MKRRDFLKGFVAVTGTLAIAPGIALLPTKVVEIRSNMGLMHLLDNIILRSYTGNISASDFQQFLKEFNYKESGKRIGKFI